MAELAFRNPANGYVERSSHHGLWTLLFGPIYFAVRGIWKELFEKNGGRLVAPPSWLSPPSRRIPVPPVTALSPAGTAALPGLTVMLVKV